MDYGTERTAGQVLTLHVTHPCLIPRTIYDPLSSIRSDSWEQSEQALNTF